MAFTRREFLAGISTTGLLAILGIKLKLEDQKVSAANERSSVKKSEIPLTGTIKELRNWPIGFWPNYTVGFSAEGKNYIATSGSSVNLIDVDSSSVIELFPCQDTNPLDLAYDEKKDRIVAASADPRARMIIIDRKTKEVLAKITTTDFVGKGLSEGGMQGITVDADGNYIGALAYYNSPSGVLVKVNPDTFDTSVITENIPLFHNPNGIITSKDKQLFYVFCDDGYFFQIAKDGTVLKSIDTGIQPGYRGDIDNNDNVWISYWRSDGKTLGRYNLRSETFDLFEGANGGNSVKVENDHVWTAGDAEVAVNDINSGRLLARQSFSSQNNGLSIVGNRTFFITYNSLLREAVFNSSKLFFPAIYKQYPSR